MNRYNKYSQTKAFTLIELLIVIAVIGVLASIILVRLNSASKKAKVNTIKTSLNSVVPGAILCRNDNGDVIDSGDTSAVSGSNLCSDASATPAVLPQIPACGDTAGDTAFDKINITSGDEETWQVSISTCTRIPECAGTANAYCDTTGCYFPESGSCK